MKSYLVSKGQSIIALAFILCFAILILFLSAYDKNKILGKVENNLESLTNEVLIEKSVVAAITDNFSEISIKTDELIKRDIIDGIVIKSLEGNLLFSEGIHHSKKSITIDLKDSSYGLFEDNQDDKNIIGKLIVYFPKTSSNLAYSLQIEVNLIIVLFLFLIILSSLLIYELKHKELFEAVKDLAISNKTNLDHRKQSEHYKNAVRAILHIRLEKDELINRMSSDFNRHMKTLQDCISKCLMEISTLKLSRSNNKMVENLNLIHDSTLMHFKKDDYTYSHKETVSIKYLFNSLGLSLNTFNKDFFIEINYQLTESLILSLKKEYNILNVIHERNEYSKGEFRDDIFKLQIDSNKCLRKNIEDLSVFSQVGLQMIKNKKETYFLLRITSQRFQTLESTNQIALISNRFERNDLDKLNLNKLPPCFFSLDNLENNYNYLVKYKFIIFVNINSDQILDLLSFISGFQENNIEKIVLLNRQVNDYYFDILKKAGVNYIFKYGIAESYKQVTRVLSGSTIKIY